MPSCDFRLHTYNIVICSAYKINLSYKKLHTAASHRCFVLWESEERFLWYEQTIPCSSSDARVYGLLNTLGTRGSRKIYVDDLRKLNTLKHPGEENSLVWKMTWPECLSTCKPSPDTFFFFWCGQYFLKSLLNMLQYCFFSMFWFFGHEAHGILALRPGIEPAPPALEGEVLTTRLPGKSLEMFCILNIFVYIWVVVTRVSFSLWVLPWLWTLAWFFKKIYLFIFFWLCCVFVAVHGLSLVAASRSYSSLRCTGFSLWWLLLLRSMGSRHAGFSSCGIQASVVVVRRV